MRRTVNCRFGGKSGLNDAKSHHARPVIADGKVIGVVMVTRSPRGLFIGIWQDRFAILLGAGLIFLTLLVLALYARYQQDSDGFAERYLAMLLERRR